MGERKGGEGRALSIDTGASQESWGIWVSDCPRWDVVLLLVSGRPLSTTMVENVGDGWWEIGVSRQAGVSECGEEQDDEAVEFPSSLLEGFRAGRFTCLRLAPSCVYVGLLELTMLPFSSLQSLFLVAKTPNPSPPASSSFSLWRAMCLSITHVLERIPIFLCLRRKMLVFMLFWNCLPRRSRRRKWALQRRHVLFPSLWFNA